MFNIDPDKNSVIPSIVPVTISNVIVSFSSITFVKMILGEVPVPETINRYNSQTYKNMFTEVMLNHASFK